MQPAETNRTNKVRDVAQPGSVLAWGARGRKFESCRPDKTDTKTHQRSLKTIDFQAFPFLSLQILSKSIKYNANNKVNTFYFKGEQNNIFLLKFNYSNTIKWELQINQTASEYILFYVMKEREMARVQYMRG